MGFATLDYIVLGGYFVLLLGVAWWVIRQKQNNAEDYFLAGRHAGWFVVGSAIFASNIGSEHIVGLAGGAYEDGAAWAYYELHSWIVLLLGWVFIPFYLRSGVFTMPEFLERRYNPTARWILSIMSLVAYVLTKVSVTVYAGAIVLTAFMDIEFWTGALITVVLTGAYTILGGMRAVIYTETLQAFVLLIGSVFITVIGLGKVGGFSGLTEIVGREQLDMFLPANDPDVPWPGIIITGTIVGVWYWCTDQYIVQRTLAAANIKEARRGTIFAGYLKLTPVFLFLLPGIIGYAMVQSGQLEIEKADQTFPILVQTLLPVGLRGLVVGGLMAALMSSLAAIFNSCSTLFTMDIYRKLRPDTSQESLVRIGQIATLGVVILGCLWIPIMQDVSDKLYIYLQNVQAYLAPPIFCAFVLGISWKRINGRGAVWGMLTGFGLGLSRLTLSLLDYNYPAWMLMDMNWLYFAIVLTGITMLVMIGVSYTAPAPSEAQLAGLTFSTVSKEDSESNRKSWNKYDVIHTVIIIGAIIGIMWWLRG
ncbi:MAG: SSS family solute:Na+ symporter [Limisphaerales bacterium]|jgi:SSS family solute:Na+ symporter